MSVLTRASRSLEQASLRELTGVVTHVQGLGLRVADLPLAVGALVRVESVGRTCCGEVVGFDAERTVVMLLGDAAGVRRGDRVVSGPVAGQVPVGRALVGRVLDALGRPLDGKGPLRGAHRRPLAAEPLDPMQRVPIDQPLGTGVRAVDAMLPVGRGQRLGIFSGPGIGKSTLLGMIARQTEADVSVVALIGERGREVRDFIENALGPEGLKRSVVIAATADEPALMRLRAARYAACVAETFRDRGADVVLFMDSITRFCQAQRQVGLAAGEPPATRGYPPSV
ncbi:MAG: EscN/YscN/HrcN family type III secretion system ATPase, partial [Phycisphaerae bacterium]|nr:EscN/YscN/HrcN family type III secretion system ATPase [Phycisphaerae bacterium]